jgi:hypothetical protein
MADHGLQSCPLRGYVGKARVVEAVRHSFDAFRLSLGGDWPDDAEPDLGCSGRPPRATAAGNRSGHPTSVPDGYRPLGARAPDWQRRCCLAHLFCRLGCRGFRRNSISMHVARPSQLRDASTVRRLRPAHQSMVNRRHDNVHGNNLLSLGNTSHPSPHAKDPTLEQLAVNCAPWYSGP